MPTSQPAKRRLLGLRRPVMGIKSQADVAQKWPPRFGDGQCTITAYHQAVGFEFVQAFQTSIQSRTALAILPPGGVLTTHQVEDVPPQNAVFLTELIAFDERKLALPYSLLVGFDVFFILHKSRPAIADGGSPQGNTEVGMRGCIPHEVAVKFALCMGNSQRIVR